MIFVALTYGIHSYHTYVQSLTGSLLLTLRISNARLVGVRSFRKENTLL